MLLRDKILGQLLELYVPTLNIEALSGNTA